MSKFKIHYCQGHYYHNYEDDRWFGGLVECTFSKEFDSISDAESYGKAHEWEWDENPQWQNKKYKIIEI